MKMNMKLLTRALHDMKAYFVLAFGIFVHNRMFWELSDICL